MTSKKEIVENSPAVGKYFYHVIRSPKTTPDQYGKFYFSMKVFKTYTFVNKEGKSVTAKDFTIPAYDKGFTEYLAALNVARAAVQKHEANDVGESSNQLLDNVVNQVNTAATDKCPI